MAYATIRNTDWVVETKDGHILTPATPLTEAYGEFYRLATEQQAELGLKWGSNLRLRSDMDIRRPNLEWGHKRSLGFWQDAIREYRPLHETLELLRSAVPNRMVVAGGALRDLVAFEEPARIKDIDVFVLGVKAESDWEALLEQIALLGDLNFADIDPDIRARFWWGRYARGDGPARGIVTTLSCPSDPTKELQIIGIDVETVEELLAQFDWTVCKFAFDGERIWPDGMKDFVNKQLTLNSTRGKDLYRVLERGMMIERKLAESSLSVTLTLEEIGKLADAEKRQRQAMAWLQRKARLSAAICRVRGVLHSPPRPKMIWQM